jgi:hypothetical protein
VTLDKYGSFLLPAEHLRTLEDGTVKQVAVSFGHVSNPYPREYASFEPDLATLDKGAKATGGNTDPASVAAIFDPQGEKVTFHEELWQRFVLAAIGIFLLDLFVRRVRLFDRKFVAKKHKSGPGGPMSRSGGPMSRSGGPMSRRATQA